MREEEDHFSIRPLLAQEQTFGSRLRKHTSPSAQSQRSTNTDDEAYDSDLLGSSESDGMMSDLEDECEENYEEELNRVIVKDPTRTPLLSDQATNVRRQHPPNCQKEISIRKIATQKDRLPRRKALVNKIAATAWDRVHSLPRKTTIASLVMFIMGLFFSVCGLLCVNRCKDPKFAIGWFVAGGVLLCPGAYSVFIIYHIVFSPDSGYSMDQLPSYDDED